MEEIVAKGKNLPHEARLLLGRDTYIPLSIPFTFSHLMVEKNDNRPIQTIKENAF